MREDLLAAIDQQLTSPQTKYVATTLSRLLKLGVPEADAKSQLALCLGEALEEMVRRHRSFDEPAYRAALDALPLVEEPEDPAAEGDGAAAD